MKKILLILLLLPLVVTAQDKKDTLGEYLLYSGGLLLCRYIMYRNLTWEKKVVSSLYYTIDDSKADFWFKRNDTLFRLIPNGKISITIK